MSWLNNAVIYQIFIDRFAGFDDVTGWDEPKYLGGNIKGIIDNVPYLKDLGVNVIWLSPFYKGVVYHGYHITDFYNVDEHFGSEEDLKKLIHLVHENGMKIICDFVPNHCSNQHPFFIDALNDKNSKYRDWFKFDSKSNDYMCFLSYKELPKFNLDNRDAREHILGAARKWMKLGFDGYRIDHVIGVSNNNLRKIVEPLIEEFPESVFIGEAVFMGIKFKELVTINVPKKYLIWMLNLKTLLYKNYDGILDGVLDFRTAKYFEKYALGKDKYKVKIQCKLKEFDDKLDLITFLDNHDVERFLFRCGGDTLKLKKAAKLQFSLKNPTIIYYGTEVGLSQKAPFSSRQSYPDILARKPMIWEVSNQDLDLLKYYKSLIKNKLGSN